MSSLLKVRRRRGRLWLRGTGYRLRFRLVTRVLWTMLLLASVALFADLATVDVGLWSRLLSVGVVLMGLAGIRIMWGPSVVVAREGLRIYRPWWPLRRDLAWYRILGVDIVPGFWFLEIEMNSGERIELPVVEHLDRLFEDIEDHRRQLDSV